MAISAFSILSKSDTYNLLLFSILIEALVAASQIVSSNPIVFIYLITNPFIVIFIGIK